MALTLAAFAIRFTDTAARTYWLDEGFTLYRVLGSWLDLATNHVNLQGQPTTDIHPQLYFAALKLWILAGGMNEFSLRVFSLLCAVLLVPMTYALGRRAFGPRTGLFAAVLALLCPAYQWYGWEIRMYSLTPLLAALSTYLLLRALAGESVRRRALAGWALVSLVSALTHYSSISLLMAQSLLFAPKVFAQLGKVRARYWIALALALSALAVAVLVLPGASELAQRAIGLVSRFLASRLQTPVTLLSLVHDILGASTFGMNAADPTGGYLEGVVAALFLAGLVLPFSPGRPRQRTLMGLSVAIPILFWALLSYVLENRPSFRYVIIVVPAIHTVLGRVASGIWERSIAEARGGFLARRARAAVGAILIGGILGLNAFGLINSFVRTPTWQDEWASMSRYLRQNARPGDAIVINEFTPELVLREYLDDLPIDMVPSRGLVIDYDIPGSRAFLASTYARVWHANTGGDAGSWSAEVRAILQPFDRRSSVTFPSRTSILRLDRYDTRPAVSDAVPSAARALGPLTAADGTRPVAFELLQGSQYDRIPGVTLRLHWARSRSGPMPASIAIRLLDDAGGVWMDWQVPADLEWLPRDCVAGKICAADYTLLLPPGLPPIAYRLELAPLTETGALSSPRLTAPLSAADISCCLRAQRALAEMASTSATDVALADAEFPDRLRPGDPLALVLTWRPILTTAPGWATRISLTPLIGNEVASVVREAGPPDLPPPTWPVGELIRDQYALPLPYTIAPGVYRLMLARTGPGAPAGDSFLGFVQVEDFPRSPVPASVPVTITARVGDMTLLGYGVDAPFARGDTTELRTLWRADRTPGRDGVLFAHVLSPQGKLVAQDDDSPEQGKRATQTYRTGDGIDQLQRLALPADLPAGEYRVMTGIYDRTGGARWPATRDGQPARDDLVPLMTFTLPELPPTFRAFLPLISAGDGK